MVRGSVISASLFPRDREVVKRSASDCPLFTRELEEVRRSGDQERVEHVVTGCSPSQLYQEVVNRAVMGLSLARRDQEVTSLVWIHYRLSLQEAAKRAEISCRPFA